LKAHRIIKSILRQLIASKVDDLKQQYVYRDTEEREPESATRKRKIPESIFNEIVNLDPTPQKKYLQWMLMRYTEAGRVDLGAFEVVTRFNDLVNKKLIKGEEADIFRYKTVETLYDFAKRFEDVKSHSEEKREIKEGGADVAFENDRCVIYKIKSIEASRLYGAGTKWCTTEAKSSYYFNNYYFKNAISLYYILPKGEWAQKYGKVALAIEPGGQREIFDVLDNPLTKTKFVNYLKKLRIPL
jgi:hypothetical protein